MAKISRIVLELAREAGHPYGNKDHGYHLYLPLTADGHIDVSAFPRLRHACRVRRFRPGEDERRGKIIRKGAGAWRFDYDSGSDFDDEVGFRLNLERFVPGEYVSVREDDGNMHTFQVVDVRPE